MQSSEPAETLPPQTYPGMGRAWTSAGIIFLVAAIGMADRLAISMLIGPIKQDFGIGDFEASMLVGAAFASFYIIALLPIGWAADRYSRKLVLFLCLAVWTFASIACGFAPGFLILFICRMFVGAGEAGLGPAGYGIIGSNFPRKDLAKPIALYNMGFSGGAALGVAAAGAILAAGANGQFDHIPILRDMAPWRIAFILIGVPGFLALLLIPLLHDQKHQTQTSSTSVEPLRPYLRSNKRLWTLFYIAAPCASVGFLTITSWAPELLQRKFEVPPMRAGAAFGGAMLTAGLLAPPIYSTLVDALFKRGFTDATIRVGLIPLICSIPLAIGAMMASTEGQFMSYLLALLICLGMLGPMGFTLLQQLTPDKFRSRLTSILILIVTVTGLGIGTSFVGWLSEYVFGEANLHLAILVTVLIFHSVAILAYLVLRPVVRHSLDERMVGQ